MGMYKYIREAWKKPKQTISESYRELLLQIRREPSTVRLERPTRLDRARSLGYRAKQGILVVRQRVQRGGRGKPLPAGGRRSKRYNKTLILKKNYQQVAEERASRKYPNCEILNSYFLMNDGKSEWYEIIMIDRDHPQVQADKNLAAIAEKHGRTHRGLTSAGRKSRGLRYKGFGSEKARPSQPANKGRTN